MKKTISIILIFLSTFCYSQNDAVKEKIKDLQELYSNHEFQKIELLSKEILNNQYGNPTNEEKLTTLSLLSSILLWDDYENMNYSLGYNYTLELLDLLKYGISYDFPEKDKIIKDITNLINDLEIKHPQLKTTKVISSKLAETNSQTQIETETKVAETTKPVSDEKTVTLTVSGTGKTLEEAKTNALRSAIEQAFGAFISSKTEILNDQVVADQIASVSSGNIQSYDMLNESQLPDDSWGVTLKALVSVSKLTSFVEAKGIAIEIKGGMFAMNIKQQLLNEQGEIKAVSEMVGLLHEPMQTAFDYSIKSGEPKSLDSESKNWEIPLVVTATTNKNIDFCANYCIKTLEALSLSSEEVTSYQSLNKAVFSVVINYNGVAKTFYLRKQSSINALNTLKSQWEYYTRLFTVQSGMDESNGNGKGEIHNFKNNYDGKTINFLTTGQQAATFSWEDKRTLAQIEKMTGYEVKPRGVVSKFKHGGFVVYEENGHGLVAAIIDLGEMDWNSAKTACDELVLNGYSDWHLPTKDELNALYVNLEQVGLGNFSTYNNNHYWSSTEYNATYYDFNFYDGSADYYYTHKSQTNYVRGVRAF